MLEPMQSSCGCRYCHQCISEHLRVNTNKCFNIECEEITQVQPDRAIAKEIAGLQRTCPYPECEFEEKIINLVEHTKNCSKGPVMCGKCKMLIFKLKEEEHIKEVCPMTEIKCENCSCLIIRKLMNNHLNPK